MGRGGRKSFQFISSSLNLQIITYIFTDGTLIRAEEGPKVLASPPRAYMAQTFFSLAMAVYTLGGHNWRHRGDF